MRILTVRQPWGEAIIYGGKDVENRTRNIAGGYRGPVAIHTAKREPAPGEWVAFAERFPDAMSRMMHAIPWAQPEFGVILGVVDLVDVHSVSISELGMSNVCFDDHTPVGSICSPWAQNYVEFPDYRGYHLVLANPRPLAEPIPYKGALGLRSLDEETAGRVWAGIQ